MRAYEKWIVWTYSHVRKKNLTVKVMESVLMGKKYQTCQRDEATFNVTEGIQNIQRHIKKFSFLKKTQFVL